MAVLVNRAKMSTSTTGTGTITLGSAEDGYQTFADAGVANADVVRYVIEDGNNFEIGTGTYTSSGTNISRTGSESSNSDAAINLSGSATVFIGATAEDIPALYIANPVSATNPTAAGDNAVGIGDGADATGNDSIAIGTGTIAGLDSVAIGLNAASGTTTGSYNTTIGRSAAIYLTTGSNNLAVGRSALQGSNLDKVTGSGNAAIGYGAGSKNASGSNNTYLGTDAGNAITSGSSNTFIGYNADGAATTSQQTALGYQAETAGTEAIAIGNSRAGGIGTFAAQIGTNSSSYGAIGNSGTAIGGLTKTTGLDFVFGRSSIASGGSGSLSLGMDNTSSGAGSVTLGKGNTASHTDAVVIGQGASSSAADQITLGHTDQTVRISSAYTLPTSDGTNGQVLTTDGSGAVTFADAGGGSPDLYAENYTTGTKPAATGTNAVAIGKGSSAAGTEAIAMVDGTADSQDSFAVGGIVQSALGGYAIGKSSQVYSQYGLALGKSSLVTAATDGTAVGVSSVAGANSAVAFAKSRASGADSFAGAIANNSSSYGASGANSIALGKNAKATAQESVSISNTGTASGSNAAVLGGSSGTASGSGSVALGGSSNIADGVYSTAKGYYGNANGIRLKHATGVYPNQQGAYYVLGYTTSNATPIALNTSVWTPSSTNQIVLPNNSAYAFTGTIVGREVASLGTECAAWKVEGLIRREGNAGTTVLVNSATTVLSNAPSWGMALSANTSLGCLKVEVTGASKSIRWVATIHTSEVTHT